METIDQTEIDFNNNTFVNYQEYPTSTGFVLKKCQRCYGFNSFHEGIHIGAILSIGSLFFKLLK
jgi:hypothetical protein